MVYQDTSVLVQVFLYIVSGSGEGKNCMIILKGEKKLLKFKSDLCWEIISTDETSFYRMHNKTKRHQTANVEHEAIKSTWGLQQRQTKKYSIRFSHKWQHK